MSFCPRIRESSALTDLVALRAEDDLGDLGEGARLPGDGDALRMAPLPEAHAPVLAPRQVCKTRTLLSADTRLHDADGISGDIFAAHRRTVFPRLS